VANIMIMNLMSAAVALVMWWFMGYAIGFSDNPTHFIGQNK
jgi:ammonia channel protein AmtB